MFFSNVSASLDGEIFVMKPQRDIPVLIPRREDLDMLSFRARHYSDCRERSEDFVTRLKQELDRVGAEIFANSQIDAGHRCICCDARH